MWLQCWHLILHHRARCDPQDVLGAQYCGAMPAFRTGHRLQVDCACLLEGDGNGDGVVDVQDVLGVLGAYACTCDGCPE